VSGFSKNAMFRYGEAVEFETGDSKVGRETIDRMMSRGSCRHFGPAAVTNELLETLCAVALASPTKSDLQQRDIILIENEELRDSIKPLLGGSGWAAEAPAFLIFCGNNRRQRLLHEIHELPFANDHFDPLFNAIGDAAIALATFVTAAEALGLGTCPVSQIRNHPNEISELLKLPDLVFPFAALAVGWPSGKTEASPRLPLKATVHRDYFEDSQVEADVRAYDERRELAQPYKQQRLTDLYGEADTYGWSMEKARHYSQSERSGFAQFLRSKGFKFS
jgi:nitroreductase